MQVDLGRQGMGTQTLVTVVKGNTGIVTGGFYAKDQQSSNVSQAAGNNSFVCAASMKAHYAITIEQQLYVALIRHQLTR
ncbi:MAG: hypothetical protein V1245_03305 [Arenicellales bacterium]|jgi:hypothetical protein|nr:hypothetical protein [Arenicellales bacterium]